VAREKVVAPGASVGREGVATESVNWPGKNSRGGEAWGPSRVVVRATDQLFQIAGQLWTFAAMRDGIA
jgi:hypothetical protein